MKHSNPGLFIPSILVLDDEPQVHSAIRLRLGRSCRLTNATSAAEALSLVSAREHDLCIVDIQLPGIDGLTFIEQAQELDPALGFVVFSSFDSDENLRRTIPLQVYEFISKPLPDKSKFDKFVPLWVDRTRARRRQIMLGNESAGLLRELETSRLQRDIEATASETARDALVNSAGLLSTALALVANAAHGFDGAARQDPKLLPSLRSLQEARKHVEGAAALTEHYFLSAYADRDGSRAIVDSCTRDATVIARRLGKADEKYLAIDCQPLGRDIGLSSISGLEFLLLLTPSLLLGIHVATPKTTLRLVCEPLGRLDDVFRVPCRDDYLWINRRGCHTSNPGIALNLSVNGAALSEADAAAWMQGNAVGELPAGSLGFAHAIQKAKGAAAIATKPKSERFAIVIALPY